MNQDTDTFNQWIEKLTPDAPLFRLRDWHLKMFVNFPWRSYEANTGRITESIDLLMENQHAEDSPVRMLWRRGMAARDAVSEDMSILMLGSMAYPLVCYADERRTFYHALVSHFYEMPPRSRYSYENELDMLEEHGQKKINIDELETLVRTRFFGGKEVVLGLEVWRRYLNELRESIRNHRQELIESAFGVDVVLEASPIMPKKRRAVGDTKMHDYERWFRQYVEFEQRDRQRGVKFVASRAYRRIADLEGKEDETTISKGIKALLEEIAKKFLGIPEIS